LSDRIKLFRKEKCWGQKQLAEKVGVVQATVSAWEKGIAGPNPTQRARLLDVFGITLNELYGIESKSKPSPVVSVNKVPIISWVHANKFEDIPPIRFEGEYAWTTIKGECVFALRVENDCMEPRFMAGDTIIVKKDLEVRDGDFVVVADYHSNTATFKQYKQYGKTIILHPLNPKYKDIELDHKKQYHIVGIVVETLRKERR